MSSQNIQSARKLERAAPLSGANKQNRLAVRRTMRDVLGNLNTPLFRTQIDPEPPRASLG